MKRLLRLAMMPPLLGIACSLPGADRAENARAALQADIPLGTPLNDAKQYLEGHASFVHEFPPSECTDFVFEPRFRCAGGSALVATLEENIQPWHPIVRTDVRALLSFNEEQRLVASYAYVESSDR